MIIHKNPANFEEIQGRSFLERLKEICSREGKMLSGLNGYRVIRYNEEEFNSLCQTSTASPDVCDKEGDLRINKIGIFCVNKKLLNDLLNHSIFLEKDIKHLCVEDVKKLQESGEEKYLQYCVEDGIGHYLKIFANADEFRTIKALGYDVVVYANNVEK